ncbi:hypothetical protein N9O88_00195 [bacterium]|nr:hypothetical protein [bacterium]
MKFSIIEIIMIILILILAIKIYSESDYFNLKCIISNVDGKEYCVRERKLLNQAADKLAHTSNDLKKLVTYCKSKFPNNPAVIRMVSKFNPKKIQETLPTSSYTAYSENKGEKIAFCLDKKKGGEGGLIDQNTLNFVALHELSHVATESVGHTNEFWDNFKFLLQQAEKINIYHPEDYKKNPKHYCGMDITDNPYFDH